ncbi:MAG TPA: DUF1080 domain-containing protein [Tepidisphaeraceae bacterium]|nr:DUF1080 domain-containing protein [Tepidisphaeraceae bacterium]
MNRRALVKGIVAAGLAAMLIGADRPAASRLQSGQPDSEGFVSLFDGQTLDGWEGLPGFWSVQDGAITGSENKQHAAPQTFLVCKRQFGNFELHFKYKFGTPDGNSGVQFRSKMLIPKNFRVGGYQADMDGKRGYDGTIYDEAGVAGGRNTMSNRGEKTVWTAENKRETQPLPESNQELKNFIKHNDWNDVVLVADGPHITYTINGHLMTDLTDNSPKALHTGLLALQLHQGFVMTIQFKDIKIKELGQ